MPLPGFEEVILLQINQNYIASQVFNGLVLGMTYILMALGLSIIFGIMGIINFAHGEFLMVGAYAAWFTATFTGSFIISLLAAAIAVAIVGIVTERTLIRRIYEKPLVVQILLTFGISVLIRGAIKFLAGTQGKSMAVPSWGQGQLDLVFFSYPVYRLVVIGLSAFAVIALFLFLTRTDIGVIIRAGAEDREMINTLGINISYVFLIVFGVGSALAGIAGALIGPMQGVFPAMGVEYLIPSFVVVIIGGLGSLRGSILAGLILGEIVVLTGTVYGQGSQIVIYVFMALFLLVRPEGLLGQEAAFE